MQLSKTDRKYWAWSIILIFAFIFCNIKTITSLITFWYNSYVYSYGFFIPLLSGYFVWVRRDKLKSLQPSVSLLGIPVLITGLIMLILGYVSGIFLIESFSIVVTIAGIILFVFGKQFFSFLWFPIAYLLFMIPFWDYLTNPLQLPLQKFSAFTGAILIKLIGIPVFQNSVIIELPNITLEVAQECSGVNNLIAVVALAILLAFIKLKGWKRKTILISGGIIVAILANGFRVALIGALSYYNISGDLHGPFHILQGMFVSIIGYAVLFLGVWLLSKDRSNPASASISTTAQHQQLNFPLLNNLNNHALFFTIGILLIAGSYINFYPPSPVMLKADLGQFPNEIGKWRGINSEREYEVFKSLGVDHDLSRTYRITNSMDIKLYIGYFEFQKQGKELVNYRTDWLYSDSSKIKITVGPDKVINVNKTIKREGKTSKLILFWYDINSRVVTDRYKVKAFTTWDALFKRQTNGAIIIITADFPSNSDPEKILQYSKLFIKDLIPVIPTYVP